MGIIWSFILSVALLLTGLILLIFYRKNLGIKILGIVAFIGAFIIMSPSIIWWFFGC